MTALTWIRDLWIFPYKEQRMSKLAELKARVLADGSIDDAEVEVLRGELYADGTIDREEAEFLASLRNEAKSTCPAFEKFYFEALKKHVLADGSIDVDEANWVRGMVFADGTIDAAEKQFLRDLHTQAREICPEFQKLLDDALKG